MRLSDIQRRHLHDSLAHLDHLLDGMAAVLDSAARPALFPRYRGALTPERRERVAAGIAAVRAHIRRALDEAGIIPAPAALEPLSALRAQVGAAEVAAEDLGARDMRGYGPLDPATEEALDRLAQELRAAVAAVVDDAAPAAPSAPAADLPALLAAAADDALEAMAQALAEAVAAGRGGDELPLIAGDVLASLARERCLAQGLEPPAHFDIDRIPWRLDRPRLAGFGADYVTARFRKQLAPLREAVAAALRAYGRRAVAGRPQ